MDRGTFFMKRAIHANKTAKKCIQFLNKTKVYPSRAWVTLAEFGYPV
jgi:hypothetical protein